MQSVFSGLAVAAGHPAEPITQLTSDRLRFVARPFLPSTRAILIEHWKMSTPKVCASAINRCVEISFLNDTNQAELRKLSSRIQAAFTPFAQKEGMLKKRTTTVLDEISIVPHFGRERCLN
ncbi:MAG TPA: hypothetical protein VFB04_04610 [Terriglobales bacterium]|nr:hypothetical protein [Terriglobales bacterium]